MALARQAAVPDNGQWIPDEADPEGSLAAPATAAAADMGKCPLRHEPVACSSTTVASVLVSPPVQVGSPLATGRLSALVRDAGGRW